MPDNRKFGKIVVGVAAVLPFLVTVILLPAALVFLLCLETVIKALDFILHRDRPVV